MPLARRLFRITGRKSSYSAARQSCLSQVEGVAAGDANHFGGRWQVIAVIGGDSDGSRCPAAVELEVAHDGRVSFREPDAHPQADTLRRVWPFRPHCRLLSASTTGNECIVGASDRSAAWILGRTTDIDNAGIVEHAAVLRGSGFDPKQLRFITRN